MIPTSSSSKAAISGRRQAAVQAQGRIDTVNEYLKQKAEEKAAAEAEEQAAYESQKQAHKDNADAVIYGTSGEDFIIQGESTNPSTGQPINFFVDAKGVDYPSVWPDGGPPYDRDWVETADGDDVIYAPGFSIVFSKGGDDIIYMEDGYLPNENEEKLHYFSKAFAGDGSDQIFAEDGSTHAFGGDGDDLIDLGDDTDTATGGRGSDEFIVDLQNTGCDLILDFMDVGDKISIKNGGKDAVSGEWFLSEFPGTFANSQLVSKTLGIYSPDMEDWLLGESKNQKIMSIQRTNGETAAYFVVGAGAGFHDQDYHKDLGKFDVTAEVSSSSIQITSSESIAFGNGYWEHEASFTTEFS